MQPTKLKLLDHTVEQLHRLALEAGLVPLPMLFQSVSPRVMSEIGAYLYPMRYSHWSFGKAYSRLHTACQLGALHLYEQVINSNPCCVYLSSDNTNLQNIVAVAHAIAHSDFFGQNHTCQTGRSAYDNCYKYAVERIAVYQEKYGISAVETILDACLALQPHIDPTLPLEQPELLAEQPKQHATGCSDLLYYIAAHGHKLAAWERDILVTTRTEMLYLKAQEQTKVINEGWAVYWHTRLLHQLVLSIADKIEFAAAQSSLLKQASYLVGMRIWEQIFDNRATHSATDLTNSTERCIAGLVTKPATEPFLVRAEENDASFLNQYMTEQLAVEVLHTLDPRQEPSLAGDQVTPYRTFLLTHLLPQEPPLITALDGDYHGTGELYLQHRHDGRNLDIPHAYGVLKLIASLWRNPVHLETSIGRERVLLTAE